MQDLIKDWWPMLWAVVISAVQIILILLSKTYARREELNEVKQEVQKLKSDVDALPASEYVHQLKVELAEVRGEIKELSAALKPVNHLAQLLLEQQLNNDNKR